MLFNKNLTKTIEFVIDQVKLVSNVYKYDNNNSSKRRRQKKRREMEGVGEKRGGLRENIG